MGHSEYAPGFSDRRPWNAGRKLGAKRALKPQQVWPFASGLTMSNGPETGRCSIWRSTASCAAAGPGGRSMAAILRQASGQGAASPQR
jgi:hypothetical protein